MPEGPEVRIIVKQLNQILGTSDLNSIEIHSGRYSKKSPDGYPDFISQLPLQLKEVKCKGKFIWFELSNDWYIFNTLGMSGGWKVNKEKHSHFTFNFTKREVYFTDMRNFGTLKFMKGKTQLNKKLKELGEDVFTDTYNLSYVSKILKDKRLQNKTIVEVMMNQKKFCGIGNYLKSEILYACQISPHRILSELDDSDIENIYNKSKKISLESYADGGGSAGDFSDLNSKKGNYKFQMQVYNQKTDPLGNKVKKESTKDKRTSHWVPEIQK